jgi:hypothetical protein
VATSSSKKAERARELATERLDVLVLPDYEQYPGFFNLDAIEHGNGRDVDPPQLKNGSPTTLSRWYYHYVRHRFHTTEEDEWKHTIHPGDNASWSFGSRHQFCVFGGTEEDRKTFFQLFLESSGF